jgi:hypothetical protein
MREQKDGFGVIYIRAPTEEIDIERKSTVKKIHSTG